MTEPRFNWFWVIVFALTLPAGVVLSTHLARRSFERVKFRSQTVRVKGYAERKIKANWGRWTVGITVRHADLAPAYARIEADRKRLLEFLRQHGFSSEQVAQDPTRIELLYRRTEKGDATNEIEGHELRQWFTVGSTDVQLIAKIAREASELIGHGVLLSAGSPEFLYTKLDELKMEMLSEATRNARERAERLISHSTSRLGPLRSASQGVFQITPLHSTEVSDYGLNDTSSIDKAIKAVVTVEYAIANE